MNSGTLSIDEFVGGLRRWFEGIDPDPARWTFDGLQRQQDGSFKDADLVNILQTGTECVAGTIFSLLYVQASNPNCSTGAFGANNIPGAMKAIEMLGIEQGREWGLATLNEFRHFFKLKTYSTFGKTQ